MTCIAAAGFFTRWRADVPDAQAGADVTLTGGCNPAPYCAYDVLADILCTHVCARGHARSCMPRALAVHDLCSLLLHACMLASPRAHSTHAHPCSRAPTHSPAQHAAQQSTLQRRGGVGAAAGGGRAPCCSAPLVPSSSSRNVWAGSGLQTPGCHRDTTPIAGKAWLGGRDADGCYGQLHIAPRAPCRGRFLPRQNTAAGACQGAGAMRLICAIPSQQQKIPSNAERPLSPPRFFPASANLLTHTPGGNLRRREASNHPSGGVKTRFLGPAREGSSSASYNTLPHVDAILWDDAGTLLSRQGLQAPLFHPSPSLIITQHIILKQPALPWAH